MDHEIFCYWLNVLWVFGLKDWVSFCDIFIFISIFFFSFLNCICLKIFYRCLFIGVWISLFSLFLFRPMNSVLQFIILLFFYYISFLFSPCFTNISVIPRLISTSVVVLTFKYKLHNTIYQSGRLCVFVKEDEIYIKIIIW